MIKKVLQNLFIPERQQVKMTADHKKWRKFFFDYDPKAVGISLKDTNRVFGVLMDSVEFDNKAMSYQVITQVVLLKGASSYLSARGILFWDASMSQNQNNIFSIEQKIIGSAQSLINSTIKAKDHFLPNFNFVRFFFLTVSEIYLIETRLDEVERGEVRVLEIFKGFDIIRKFAENDIT